MSTEDLNRFDRILAILVHLQSGRVVTAQELADRFGVSLRTVYRDIRSLEASGVPISGEAGVGYVIMEGYRLPPVMFTREEAGSFVAAEKLMQKFSDKTLGAYYASAMFKVKSVLKDIAKERVSSLESQVWVNSDMKLFNDTSPNALDILFESIAEKKQVALKYQSMHSEETTDRVIEPVGLFIENNFWYVMGYCHLRNDYRQFRTDRMVQINRTDLFFEKEHKDVEQHRNSDDTCEKTKVVIRVDKKILKYIQTGRKYYGFISEQDAGDKMEMTFMTNSSFEGLSRWYLMYGDCAEIVEPELFRERVNELLNKTIANLNKG